MTKRIVCKLTVAYMTLPAKKVYAWKAACKLFHELKKEWLARKREEDGSHVGLPRMSYPALAGAPVRMSPPSQPESLPGAGVAIPPFERPAGGSSPSLQAKNTTGISG